MAEDDTTEQNPAAAERRVYTLPPHLLERLRAYQIDQGIPSEAEAVRRLLDLALQMRDTLENMLEYLGTKYLEERDLRVLTGEYLAKHVQVVKVMFEENYVTFHLRNGEAGKIDLDGTLYKQQAGYDDQWNTYIRNRVRAVPVKRAQSGGGPQWDAPRGGDLDDEIPF